VVRTESDLIRQRTAMVRALTVRPEVARLLLANPVLAFRDVGVTISPAVATHILHAVRHPASVRAERQLLTDELRAALTAAPRPTDPEWLATALFTQLKVTPLVTKGRQPTYLAAIPADARLRLHALLPRRRRHRLPTGPDTGATATRRQPLRRLDLDAPVVECPVARTAPTRVSLEQLWFYRGAHDLVRPLLRLGIIEHNALPLLGAAAYRKARSGERPYDLLRWIDHIGWPENPRSRRDT
jgi:hypothetical protein